MNRTDACAHLTIVSGHCASGPTEIVMADETIREFALHVGDSVPASAIGGTGQYRLGALTIAGAYRVSRPDDPTGSTQPMRRRPASPPSPSTMPAT